jgi:ABC-type multidrug transport system ATPase subunit
MVDHNLWGLKLHCDRAFLLDNGRIEEFDDLEEAIAEHRERLRRPPDPRPEVLTSPPAGEEVLPMPG